MKKTDKQMEREKNKEEEEKENVNSLQKKKSSWPRNVKNTQLYE